MEMKRNTKLKVELELLNLQRSTYRYVCESAIIVSESGSPRQSQCHSHSAIAMLKFAGILDEETFYSYYDSKRIQLTAFRAHPATHPH